MGKSVKDIRMIIAGVERRGWIRWEVENNFLNPADGWFCSIPVTGDDIKWISAVKAGDEVKLVLDGGLYMRGRIDSKDYGGDLKSTVLELTGRDNFLHIVDNDAQPETKTNITLFTLATELTSPWSMDWQVQPGVTLKRHKRIKIEPGEKIIDVLQRIAQKERLLLWYEASGTAVIGRPNYDAEPAYKLRLWHPRSGRQNENNILPGWSVLDSWDNRYQTITVSGTSGNSTEAWGRTSHRRYVATDTDMDSTVPRSTIITDGDLKTLEQAKELATLKLQEQVMESLQVNVECKGHYAEMDDPNAKPEIWIAGKLASVLIEPAGLNALMWLKSRRLKFDTGGSRTALSLSPIGWMS